jgi:hypothetical protein
MVLAIHSDASYLSEPKARSRAGGHFFLSKNGNNPPNNGAVLNVSKIIKVVMSSAAEAELGALFINAKKSVPSGQGTMGVAWSYTVIKALEILIGSFPMRPGGHPEPHVKGAGRLVDGVIMVLEMVDYLVNWWARKRMVNAWGSEKVCC